MDQMNEGYEGVVLTTLKDCNIDGRFANSMLYVAKGKKRVAIEAIKKNTKILKAPTIIEEGTSFKDFFIGEDPIEEAVFPAEHYQWFTWEQPTSTTLHRRGNPGILRKGDMFGIRRATSSDDKYRIILKKLGPTIVFSGDRELVDKLKAGAKHLKGHLDEGVKATHEQAVAEFEKANADYKKAYPTGFSSDHTVLKKTLTLFKNKKYKEAVRIIDMADTIVREIVPESAWQMMHVNESISLTEEELFPHFDEIKIDPDRNDPYDLAHAIMPSIIRMAYTFLYHDKVKHDRTYSPSDEDENQFDFSEQALVEEVDSVRTHLKDRLDNISDKDISEMISRMMKEFKHPLDKKK